MLGATEPSTPGFRACPSTPCLCVHALNMITRVQISAGGVGGVIIIFGGWFAQLGFDGVFPEHREGQHDTCVRGNHHGWVRNVGIVSQDSVQAWYYMYSCGVVTIYFFPLSLHACDQKTTPTFMDLATCLHCAAIVAPLHLPGSINQR